jgi:hypothetical protein
MSSGVSDHILTQPEAIRISLPCEEQQFLLGIPCLAPIPVLEAETFNGSNSFDVGQDHQIGMFGHYVQVTNLRYMILR